jgi:hypothetical protein
MDMRAAMQFQGATNADLRGLRRLAAVGRFKASSCFATRRIRRMPTRRLLAAATLLVLAAACKDSTAPDPGLAGTFTLRTIAGQPLPWPQFPSEGDTAWVLGGSYVFREDSTYTITYDYRYVRPSGVSVEHIAEEGEYRVRGDSVLLSDLGADYGARREGSTLVVHGRYEDWIYRR